METKTLKRFSTNSDVKMEVNSISDYLKPNMPLPQYLPYARFLLDTDLSHTAKLLYTLQSRRSLFAGKAVFGVLEVLLVTVLELACVPVLGRVHGYTEAFPTGQLCYLFVCTLAVDAMLFFGEFLLMLWMGNPLPALCVGIVGALVGLFSAFMPPLASYFVPFGYYIPLSAYEVANWDKATHTVTYGTRPFNWGLLAFTLALGAVLFALAWRKVQDEEV